MVSLPESSQRGNDVVVQTIEPSRFGVGGSSRVDRSREAGCLDASTQARNPRIRRFDLSARH